jgi:hypothetical protein
MAARRRFVRREFADDGVLARAFTRAMLPCSSTTSREPARWCRLSMFCVTSVKRAKRCCSAASAACPGFGCTPAMRARRSAYHSHTSFGLRAKPSGVASSCGS